MSSWYAQGMKCEGNKRMREWHLIIPGYYPYFIYEYKGTDISPQLYKLFHIEIDGVQELYTLTDSCMILCPCEVDPGGDPAHAYNICKLEKSRDINKFR